MCAAMAAARPTGTAFPICLAISILEPHQRNVVGKLLQERRLEVGDHPVDPAGAVGLPLRVQVLALLRLEELGADRQRRLVPAHAAHHVGGAGRLVPPAAGEQVVGEVEAAAAGGHAVVAAQRELPRPTAEVQVAAP